MGEGLVSQCLPGWDMLLLSLGGMQQSDNELLIYLELSCYALNARSNNLLHFQSHLSGVGFRKLKVYYIMIYYVMISGEFTVYKYCLPRLLND